MDSSHFKDRFSYYKNKIQNSIRESGGTIEFKCACSVSAAVCGHNIRCFVDECGMRAHNTAIDTITHEANIVADTICAKSNEAAARIYYTAIKTLEEVVGTEEIPLNTDCTSTATRDTEMGIISVMRAFGKQFRASIFTHNTLAIVTDFLIGAYVSNLEKIAGNGQILLLCPTVLELIYHISCLHIKSGEVKTKPKNSSACDIVVVLADFLKNNSAPTITGILAVNHLNKLIGSSFFTHSKGRSSIKNILFVVSETIVYAIHRGQREIAEYIYSNAVSPLPNTDAAYLSLLNRIMILVSSVFVSAISTIAKRTIGTIDNIQKYNSVRYFVYQINVIIEFVTLCFPPTIIPKFSSVVDVITNNIKFLWKLQLLSTKHGILPGNIVGNILYIPEFLAKRYFSEEVTFSVSSGLLKGCGGDVRATVSILRYAGAASFGYAGEEVPPEFHKWISKIVASIKGEGNQVAGMLGGIASGN